MRTLVLGLYAAALMGATPALALSPETRASLEAAREGDMSRMVFHEEPRPAGDATFYDAHGNPFQMTDWPGKVVLVNFWATWCPPCLKEMPSLDRLAEAMEGEEFEVIAISADRGGPEKPQAWFDENGIDTLEMLHDRNLRASAGAGVMGMPSTLVLDREGREIARLQGDAEWDGEEARAILRAIVEATRAEG